MSVDLSKVIVVFPLLYFFSFLWPHYLFLFISHFSSLGSFNLSSFGIFYLCPILDLFLTLRATLYILLGYRKSHALQEVLNIKKTENYHDVCKCMPLPV